MLRRGESAKRRGVRCDGYCSGLQAQDGRGPWPAIWWVAPPPWGFGGAGGDEADGVGDDELVGGGEVAVGGGLLFHTTIGWPARRRGGVLRQPHCLPLATTRTPCSSSAAWREVGWEMRGEKIEVLTCGVHMGLKLTQPPCQIKPGLISSKDPE